ncbi:MAG: hypothetical protein EBQ85_05825 [Proteobacteria bacterium]|nr:hypothetical protein [Pseudomonadota bacterium]
MSSRLSKLAPWIFLSIVLTLSFFLTVGSYESRLANSISDDHPAIWARYFLNPDFRKALEGSNLARGFIFSSLPNLVIATSILISEKLPDLLSQILIGIQIIGLGFALFCYVTSWEKEKYRALFIALGSFLLNPWDRNLSYYQNLIFTPYPGQLVLPFIVGAAVGLLKNKNRIFVVCLSLAGLIHPSLTLQFLTIAFFYLLQRLSLIRDYKKFHILIPPFIASLFLPLTVNRFTQDPLSPQELLPSALSNVHLVPWNNISFWTWQIPSLIGLLLLVGIALKKDPTVTSTQKSFIRANVMAFILLGCAHWLGVHFKILPLILLCPFRVTVLTSLLLTPIAFSFLVKSLSSEDRAVRIFSTCLLFLYCFSQRGLFWLQLLGLAHSKRKYSGSFFQRFLILCMFAWWAFFILAGAPFRHWGLDSWGSEIRYWLAPGINLTTTTYLICLFLIGIAFNRRKNEPLFLSVFIIVGLWGNWKTGQESFYGKNWAVWEVQKWARRQTPEDSQFIITQGSWEGISRRKGILINKRPTGTVLPYFKFRDLVEEQKPLMKFFDDHQVSEIKFLDQNALKELGRLVKADFLVFEKTTTDLPLNLCYENSVFQVYSLGARSCPS